MNELLRGIAEKERRLEAESLSVQPPTLRWTFWPFVLAALVWGAVAATDAFVKKWQREIDPARLHEAISKGPIPWQHYTEQLPDGGPPCDVWLSARGLAHVECQGAISYHGVGITDGDGFHPWPSGADWRIATLRPATAISPWPKLALDAAANAARFERFLREEIFVCVDPDSGASGRIWLAIKDPHVALELADLSWFLRSDDCIYRLMSGWTLPRMTGETPWRSEHMSLQISHGYVLINQ